MGSLAHEPSQQVGEKYACNRVKAQFKESSLWFSKYWKLIVDGDRTQALESILTMVIKSE